MSKTFISTIIAGAIAVTSFTATPARAELTDIEKLLLGAGALAIIGTVIHESQRDDKKKRVVVRQHSPSKKTVKKKHRLAPLPAYCLRNVSSYDGSRRILGARCLRNNYNQVDRLPNRCRIWVEGPRGTRMGYRPRCLRNAGFQIHR